MRRWPTVLLVIASVIAAAQVVRRAPTNPPVASDLVAPVEIKRILRAACYDCHSNETRWPWYTGVVPVSWLIHHDVNEGRRRLNFSQWADYASDPGTLSQKLQKISEFVANGDMAPWYYRLLHRSARLPPTQRAALIRWVKQATIPQ